MGIDAAVGKGDYGLYFRIGEVATLCHLRFDSVEAFQKAFGPHAAEITGDIPNYTNVQPIIQISDIKSS